MVVLLNLWVFYLGGYIIAMVAQAWATKKRGMPFEDPDLLINYRGKKVFIIGISWIFSGLIISIYVPINIGLNFLIGIIISALGMLIVLITFYSFAHESGLTTSRIHKISRNPNYIGWITYFIGLTLIGWSDSIWSIIFLCYLIVTIFYLHFTILLEEKFLEEKYGDKYKKYKNKVPRYFSFKGIKN